MLDRVHELIDYDEIGTGPTIVLVPGSCSTGAAWRPVIACLHGQFRCITTSLLGYGGTVEQRNAADASTAHEAEALEWVVRRAGERVHLVGHSFGGLVSLAVALRNQADLASLTILEAPALELLPERGEHQHYRTIRRMTDAYFRSFHNGNTEAIAAMIGFYGGAGTFAAWPERVRAYAVQTTPVNILDWASAYGFPLSAATLGLLDVPTLVATGKRSHPAMHAINVHISDCIGAASLAVISDAAHFMLATHAPEVASRIAEHVNFVERTRRRKLLFAPKLRHSD